jgi:hypothetical protein
MLNNALPRLLKGKTIFLLFSGTLIMMGIVLYTGAPLQTKKLPGGIVELELAGSYKKVQYVIETWKNGAANGMNLIGIAKTNTYLDFFFLLFYAPFLYGFARNLAKQAPRKNNFYSLLHKFAMAALIAGVLDILENGGMLLSLFQYGSPMITMFTLAMSSIKWLLILVLISLILVALAAKLYYKTVKVLN